MSTVNTLGLCLVAVSSRDFDTWPPDRSLKQLSEDARSLRRRALKGVGVEIQRALFVQVARRIDSLGLEYRAEQSLMLHGLEAEAWLGMDQLLEGVDLSVLCPVPPVQPKPIAPAPKPEAISVSTTSETRTSREKGGLLGWVGSLLRRKSKSEVTPVRSETVIPPVEIQQETTVLKPTPVITCPILGEQILFPGDEVAGWMELVMRLKAEKLCQSDPTWRELGTEKAAALLFRVGQFLAIAKSNNCAVARILIDTVTTKENEVANVG